VIWVIVHLFCEACLLHLAESVQTVYPYRLSIHFRIHPAASVPPSINTSVTQCHWKPCMPMPSHFLHHDLQMMMYVLDHKLFQAFLILFSFRHSGTGWSKGTFTRQRCTKKRKSASLYRQQHCQNDPRSHGSTKTTENAVFCCQASSCRCHFVKKHYVSRLNT